MVYTKLDNKRECRWRIVFDNNDGGLDDEKANSTCKEVVCLHDK